MRLIFPEQKLLMCGQSPLLGAVFGITDLLGTRSVTQPSLADSWWEAHDL